jgi:uncharacterized membrane protein YjdF
MDQIKTSTNALTNNPTLTRDLALTVTAGIVFMQVGTYSNGWFLPVLTYIIAVAALFATVQRHSAKPLHKVWFHIINALGCTGLISALWFSGKMALML